jgi:hypothetical protein
MSNKTVKCESCILFARCLPKVSFSSSKLSPIDYNSRYDIIMDCSKLFKCKSLTKDFNYKYYFLKKFFLKKKGIPI